MNPSLPDTFDADVVATFGRHLIVRDAASREIPARPSGRKLGIVCGDRVRCELDRTHDEVLAVEVLPRRTVLARANLRGGSEAVVANLSQLVVVLAPLPEPDFFVVDRYLCAATSAGLEAAVAVNKIDIDGEDSRQELAAYGAAGYKLVRCSAKKGDGLAELRQVLAGHRSTLVGQSGVGKSSLVNALLPQLDIATGDLASDDEGRHTTTASRSYSLESGGALIDSPGVRDFAPAIEQLDERTMGFPEVSRLAGECRFQDCKHLQEPNCAVSTAASTGALAPRRYESYRRLRRLYADLVTARGPGYRRRPG
jgi:ribosome biogenesis GTPase / thiamine phosphate phosphatase